MNNFYKNKYWKIIFKRISYLIIITFIFPSCEEESLDEITLGTISTNMGDSFRRHFDTGAKAAWISLPQSYDLKIYGSGGFDEISITVNSLVNISAKTYNSVQILFLDGNLFSPFPVEYNSTSATVTISAIDSKEVKGTFSGTIRCNQNNTTKKLSNGLFYVSF